MFIDRFFELSKSGGFSKIDIVEGKDGFAILATSNDGLTEPVRLHTGKIRYFTKFETLLGKLRDADVLSFSVACQKSA
jgi:hypothetical protein